MSFFSPAETGTGLVTRLCVEGQCASFGACSLPLWPPCSCATESALCVPCPALAHGPLLTVAPSPAALPYLCPHVLDWRVLVLGLR